ncbi:MAG: hypothetical protein HRU15_04635, partial [Planctomycetes bacterium]|nr:hypothetical protein [Planctomycetota bacterium]
MFRVSLLCCFALFFSSLLAVDEKGTEFSIDEFAAVVIQDDGRLKPIDTFARKTLLGLLGKQQLGSISARDWFLRILTDQDYAEEVQVFTIRSPAVVEAIGVTAQADSRYALIDLIDNLTDHESYIRALDKRDAQLLDETEKQLMQVYRQVASYVALIRSFSCFWPDIHVDAQLAAIFGGEGAGDYSYFFFVSQRAVLRELLTQVAKKKEANENFDGSSLESLWLSLSNRVKNDSAETLTIIPPSQNPVAMKAHEGMLENQWRSPWSILNAGTISEVDLSMLRELNAIVAAAAKRDSSACAQAVMQYRNLCGSHPYIAMEVTYNKADLFYRSLYFYIAAFIVLMLFWIMHGKRWYQASFALFACGVFLHLSGVVMRCIIMSRPPVSTLYESIIFASLIAVLFGLAVEYCRKDTFALLAALIIGIVLQFIGFSYAAEGDTMGMLQA